MTRGETRQLLIQVGTEVIGQHGFNPTGLNTILKTAIAYAELISHFLTDETLSPLQRIRHYLESGLAAIADDKCKRGCLIGSLGQELSSQNETFRLRLDNIFDGWKQQFSECLQAAIAHQELAADTDTEQLAEFLLSGWQGAVLRAKMQSSIAPLQVFIDILFKRILIAD